MREIRERLAPEDDSIWRDPKTRRVFQVHFVGDGQVYGCQTDPDSVHGVAVRVTLAEFWRSVDAGAVEIRWEDLPEAVRNADWRDEH